jgi:glycosyltransferase involved in cell wall biosynthesis
VKRDSRGSSRSLRILVVNWLDRENPQAGGAEEHLHRVFGRLAQRGHSVTALVSGWAGCRPRVTLDGIDVHRAGRRYTFSLAAPRYYRKHLSASAFDVVVEDLNKIPMFTRYWVDAPVVMLAHHLFGATAFQAAALPVAVATWLLERPIPRLFRETHSIAVSESTKGDLVRRGLNPKLIDVIPNGVAVDHFMPPPDGEEADTPTVFFLGRLKKYKRVDLVIEAIAQLSNGGSDVELLVGGTGGQRERLQAQAARLGVSRQVHFLGFISEERKLELLQRSWVHVLTSSKEGWGISNLEAAACGTPTVASDSPGLRESVIDGETGLLVPHGDVGAVRDALETILSQPERRRAMGRKARTFAEGFSWDAAADRFDELLQRVVAGAGPEYF